VQYKNKHSFKQKDKERDRRKKKQSVTRKEIKNNKISGLHQSRHASGSIYFPTRGKTVEIPLHSETFSITAPVMKLTD